MKKIFFARFSSVLAVLIVSLISYGQVAIVNLQSSDISTSKNPILKNASGFISRNDVNSRAARNFTKEYKNVSDEKWLILQDGFIAKFNLNDIEYMIAYNKKGNWVHAIRFYHETELSSDIRHIVKSTYYDYNIILIQEIEKPRNNLTYIIHLEGKTDWINLKINDEEMEEWQKFKKSE